MPETSLALLQLHKAGGEVLLAGGNGAQLLLQAPLLHRHGLLMAGGIDLGQLHLLFPVLEFFLAWPEIPFPGRLPGGRVAEHGATRLEAAQATKHCFHCDDNLRHGLRGRRHLILGQCVPRVFPLTCPCVTP